MTRKILLFFAFLSLVNLVAAKEILISDSRNHLVKLERPPERILITGRAGFMISNLALLFDSADAKLLVYSRSSQFRQAEEFYRLVDANFDKRPALIDRNIGLEEIAAFKPDLVLCREIERNRLEKGLKMLGIPVVFFDLEDPKVFYREILTLGKIFEDNAKAQLIVAFFSKWQKLISERILEVSRLRKAPKVLHLFYSEREGPVSFSVAPASWIQTRMVQAAGGLPVWAKVSADKGWKKIGFEQIAAWKPDYIFITSYFSDVEKAVESLRNDSMWQMLDAVKNKRLFAFPEDYVCWDQPDTRWILGQCWIAAVLNPEVPELKTYLTELITEFFGLYGLSAQQIREIPMREDLF